jgi:SAM-dependent methyltransferase
MTTELTNRTIEDFGDQWAHYTENDGYYGSTELFADIFGPLLAPSALKGKSVAEIGSGSGRIVSMLLAADVSHVVALEPSAKAMTVLRANTAQHADRITYLECTGDKLPEDPAQDAVISIGVLHHIPDPSPVVAAAYRALKPNGRMLIWLYGREGNRAYLSLVLPLRAVTTRLPHMLLAPLCRGLNVTLAAYIWLARRFPVPLRGYMTEVIGHFSAEKRYLVIYDQLNPAYAKYYRRDEARLLLKNAGFKDVMLHHRHGYSWTVVGRRAAAEAENPR